MRHDKCRAYKKKVWRKNDPARCFPPCDAGGDTITRTNTELPPVGIAGLTLDGAEDADGREPSIFKKSINEVADIDYDSVRCITGFANDIQLFDRNAFINRCC